MYWLPNHISPTHTFPPPPHGNRAVWLLVCHVDRQAGREGIGCGTQCRSMHNLDSASPTKQLITHCSAVSLSVKKTS